MRRLLLPALLALVGASAPAARGATLATDRDCYLQTSKTVVTMGVSGFPADQPALISLDGAVMPDGHQAIRPDGTLSGAFNPPPLRSGEYERTFMLDVSAAGVSARKRFTVTRFRASFSPSRGNVERMRVRFSAYGFGLLERNPTIYLHYVAPSGRHRKTIRLGQARGHCGSLPRTRLRRLFPFRHPEHGLWRLQFDTSRSYRKGTVRSRFLFYTLGVRVRSH